MRSILTAVIVAALAIGGASAHGAIGKAKPPIASAAVKPGLWCGFVIITYASGKTDFGYASWWGSPETVVIFAPSTDIFAGHNLLWRKLTKTDLYGASVVVVQLDSGACNGPYNPRSTWLGL